MSWIFEPTITCWLWKILEERQGFEVGGELNVGEGYVDLVVREPTGEYVGLEVKDFSKIHGKSKLELRFVDQILKCMISGYFNYFYVCVPEEDVPNLEITLDPRRYLSPVYWFNYPNEYERFREYGGYLDSCGILWMSIKEWRAREWDVDFQDLIKRWPGQLTRSEEPEIPQMNEARIRFDIWNYFTKTKDALPIREGVLPILKKGEPRRIDVMVFKGTTSPTEILRNQEKFDLIGIEVKSKSSLSNVNHIREQLNLYLNSGGLTELYLAVPPELEARALSLLEDIPDVGLISVERGINRIKKNARELEMKYDSILYEKPGFQAALGYPTKVSPRIIEIGWGETAKEYESTYRYSGKTVSTEKEKKEIAKEKQTKTLDTWMK